MLRCLPMILGFIWPLLFGPLFADTSVHNNDLEKSLETVRALLKERGIHGDAPRFITKHPIMDKIRFLKSLENALIRDPQLNFENTGVHGIYFCKPFSRLWKIDEEGVLYLKMETSEKNLSALLHSIIAPLKKEYPKRKLRNESLKEIKEVLQLRDFSGDITFEHISYIEQHLVLEEFKNILLKHPELEFKETGLRSIVFWPTYPQRWAIIKANALIISLRSKKSLANTLKQAISKLRQDYSYAPLKEQSLSEVISLLRKKNYGRSFRFGSSYQGTYKDQYDFLEKIKRVLIDYPQLNFYESDIDKIELSDDFPKKWNIDNGFLILRKDIGEKDLADALRSAAYSGGWMRFWGQFF